MEFPFVSRARYLDREREILELKRELAELRYKHDRVLDEINFRSTNFHLDERFVKKEEAQPVMTQTAPAAAEAEKDSEPTGIADAINKVGRRPSAIRQYMESTSATEYQAKEKAFDELTATKRREEAFKRMTEALKGNAVPEPAQQS
jgi:hypothetical protein